MECRYMMIECRIGYRCTYGIAAVDCEDGEKIILNVLADVALERGKAEKLADRCNWERVSVERFRERVEEFAEEE